MTYGLWLSAAGLQVNDYRQSLLANNLANANTTAFKHDLAVIHERVMESRTSPGGGRFAHPVLDDLTGGPWVRPTIHSFEEGAFEQTGNALDVAIEGSGFLAVSDGIETRYTRDGRMTLNREGDLVMVAGEGRWHVLDEVGAPIRLNLALGSRPEILEDGTLRQDGNEVARVGLHEFADRSQLRKVGTNLYRNHGDNPTASAGVLRSGYVEQSTVNPVNGLARMIEASRAYEMNANLISLQDQTIGLAATTVGRIG